MSDDNKANKEKYECGHEKRKSSELLHEIPKRNMSMKRSNPSTCYQTGQKEI